MDRPDPEDMELGHLGLALPRQERVPMLRIVDLNRGEDGE